MNIRRTIYSMMALALLCTATSCSDEIYSGGSVAAGRKVTLTVSYQGLDQKIMKTRTVATDAENQLNNLQVFVFDANEDKGKHKLVGWTYVEHDDLVQDGSKGSVSVLTTTGSRIIYGVANTEGGTYNIDDTSIPHNATDAAGWSETAIQSGTSEFTLEQFKKIMVNRTKTVINMTEANFFMSGVLNKGNAVNILATGGGNATVQDPANSSDGDINLIKLYRVVAKIKVMVTKSSSVQEFTPTGYTICNVPLQVPLITNAIKASTDADNFENIKRNLADTETEEEKTTNSNGEETTTSYQTFSFYLPGNRQNDNLTAEQIAEIKKEADQAIAGGKSERAWLAREADTGTGEGAKEFTNAPEYATYLILRGTYVGPGKTKSTDNSMRGNAVYYIHLGEFNSKNDYTDFNVERNCIYTYHITVTGLESIKVEAQKEALAGGQPGATEGYAFDFTSTGDFFTVDSHYEQVNMKFYKSDFTTNNTWDGFYFKIDEPATQNSPVYRIPLKSEKTSSASTDNTGYIKVGDNVIYEYTDASGNTVEKIDPARTDIQSTWKLVRIKQPSDLLITDVDGNVLSVTEEVNLESNNLGWTEFTKGHNVEYKEIFKKDANGNVIAGSKDYRGKRLLLYEVLREMAYNVLKMRQEGKLDGTTDAAGNVDYTDVTNTKDDFFDSLDKYNGAYREYTCFIKENYYEQVSWSKFTDTDPRMLLIAKNMDVSSDERSLYADLFYGIEQYPIYTMYDKTYADKSKTEFIIGYGVETNRDDTRRFDQTLVPLAKNTWGNTATDLQNKYPGYGRLNQMLDLMSLVTTSGRDAELEKFIKGTTKIKWSSLNPSWEENYYWEQGAYACMSRNRDLNGDGIIQPSEVRWYCPDIEQLAGIWLGEEAIPNKKARLFTGSTANLQEDVENIDSGWGNRIGGQSYYSNRSVNGTGSRPSLEAEEGFAVNIHGAFPEESGFYVRCVRNLYPTDAEDHLAEGSYPPSASRNWKDPVLGFDLSTMYAYGFYTKYYNYDKTTRTVELPYLDPEALRTTYSQYELIPHTERGTTGYVNRPKDKFVIAKYNTGGYEAGGTLADDATLEAAGVTKQASTTISATQTSSETICKNYGEGGYKWRAPNERELALMYLTGQYADKESNDAPNETCRTSSTFPKIRIGWTNGSGQHMMQRPPEIESWANSVAIRCVRDTE